MAVSAETIAAIAAEMSGADLKPLSDEERAERNLQHEVWLAECRERDRQQQAEYEQRQAEAEREARQQAAIARSERQLKLNDELRKQTERQTRDRTLVGLLDHAVRQGAFRNHAVRATGLAHQRQKLSAALDDVLALRYPPAPPEPEIADDPAGDFGSPDFDVALWSKKRRSWW